jgi:hypothetical protein
MFIPKNDGRLHRCAIDTIEASNSLAGCDVDTEREHDSPPRDERTDISKPGGDAEDIVVSSGLRLTLGDNKGGASVASWSSGYANCGIGTLYEIIEPGSDAPRLAARLWGFFGSFAVPNTIVIYLRP